jgi:hypothetical protein
MKKSKYISLLLALIGVTLMVSASQAQVTATATVTLTVVAAPGMNFTPARRSGTGSAALAHPGISGSAGMTFQSSSNVMVKLKSKKLPGSSFNFEQGQVRTFTAKELSGVSSVEIDYLGS